MDSENAKVLRDGAALLGRVLIGRSGKKADAETLMLNLHSEREKVALPSLAAQAFKEVAECLQCALREGRVPARQAAKALEMADAALAEIGEPPVTI